MNIRARIASVIVALTCALGIAGPASAYPVPSEVTVSLTATGPGMLTVDGFMSIRDTTLRYTTSSR